MGDIIEAVEQPCRLGRPSREVGPVADLVVPLRTHEATVTADQIEDQQRVLAAAGLRRYRTPDSLLTRFHMRCWR
jgi:hypothetical protein